MSEDLKSREHKFIREKIVPRKKYKKILGITAAVIGAAVLFGAAAGGTFYLLQEVLPRQNVQESQVETIIIARDDVSLSPESTAETRPSREETKEPVESGSEAGTQPDDTKEPSESPSKNTEAQKTSDSEKSTEDTGTDASDTEPESGSESTEEGGSGTSDESGSGEHASGGSSEGESDPETSGETDSGEEGSTSDSSEPESETEPFETEAPETKPSAEEPANESTEAVKTVTLQDRMREIRRGIVRLTVRESSATDWFSVAIHEKRELLGVVIAENTDSILVLTKASGFDSPTAVITAEIDGLSCSASFRQGDSLNRITVLRIPKSEVGNHYAVLPLGNSLNVSSADPVWFVGLASDAEIGLNEGMVTYIEQHRPAVDGYSQMISTNMLHYPGESGILMNSDGAVIGLVADDICISGQIMTALGISPLKYLLEDMCSGTNTAYFGIRCMDISSEEGEALGIPAGLYIQEVTPESPAYDAGLLPGDRLVRVDEGSVNTNHMLLLWMDQLESGKTILVGIERRGPEGYEPVTFSVTPGARR